MNKLVLLVFFIAVSACLARPEGDEKSASIEEDSATKKFFKDISDGAKKAGTVIKEGAGKAATSVSEGAKKAASSVKEGVLKGYDYIKSKISGSKSEIPGESGIPLAPFPDTKSNKDFVFKDGPMTR